MQENKQVKLPIPIGVNLSIEQCPKTWEEEEDMPWVPYASEVGSLMYAPYIAHAVGVLSIYMSKPGKEHWTTVNKVFRYLRGTTNYAIFYQGRPRPNRLINVHGYLDCRRSTSGYVFNLFGGAISWMSKR